MTVVLVHGGWHGAWCWEPVVAQLASRGIDAVALDLPSDHVDGAGFTDDVTAVRDLLDGAGPNAVLCGHSYGGEVITEAGAHDAVGHLVYVSAFVPDVGESLLTSPSPQVSTPLESAIRIEGGHVLVDPELAREAFYGDCDEQPVDRLVPHNIGAFNTECVAAAWKDKPSTYVLCTRDRALHPDRQRFFAARCESVVELDASHSPMLSMPGRVADVLLSCHTR